jgi:hypothetical protein
MHLAPRLIVCLISALAACAVTLGACSSCDKEGAPTEEAATGEGEGEGEGAEKADGGEGGESADVAAAPGKAGAEGAKTEEPAEGDAPVEPRAARARAAAERAKAAGDAAEPSVDSLDPEEQRRIDRERRIAELKRRNEERRKELVARATAGEEGGAEGAAEPMEAEIAGAGEAAEPGAGEAAERPGAGEAAAPSADEAGAAAEAPAETAADEPVAPPPTAAGGGLEIGRYLSIEDVRRITGDRTLTPNGTLSGIPASETYNSAYFAPPVRANFGVSLQVWIERTRRDANDRFRRMRRDYANAEDTSAAGPKAFFSYWNDILTVSFSDLTKRVVVSVSCNASICKPDQLLALANAVRERL